MALYTPAAGCLRAAVVRGAGCLRKRPVYQLVGQPPCGPQADAVLPVRSNGDNAVSFDTTVQEAQLQTQIRSEFLSRLWKENSVTASPAEWHGSGRQSAREACQGDVTIVAPGRRQLSHADAEL